MSLAAYWSQSASSSVARDYAAGRVVSVTPGQTVAAPAPAPRPRLSVSDMVSAMEKAHGAEALALATRRAQDAATDADRAYWAAVAEWLAE